MHVLKQYGFFASVCHGIGIPFSVIPEKSAILSTKYQVLANEQSLPIFTS
jgi:hypothetical protein